MSQTEAAKYNSVLLLGPPGSGKGTQGQALGRLPGYLFVSMGQLLRSLDAETVLGRKSHHFLKSGDLVPPELVIEVWRNHMRAQPVDRFNPETDLAILDGLPRNIDQAELLQQFIHIHRVIHLSCGHDIASLIERIRERAQGRDDDSNEAVIRHRFDVYRAETEPLFDWYPANLVATVDALRSPLEVLKQVVQVCPDAEQSFKF